MENSPSPGNGSQELTKKSSTFEKWIKKIKKFPLRKIHLDYIAGILSIPVLITAIIINYNNLAKNKSNSVPTPTPQVSINQSRRDRTQNNQPTSTVCQKSIGPISISFPTEEQTTTNNPVCINIDYSDSNYCSVVWSYRINGGAWSDYNSNSPCIYNPPNGNIQFQLRVNSTVSSDTTTLTRNFAYNGNNVVSTPTPTVAAPTMTSTPASSSATTN